MNTTNTPKQLPEMSPGECSVDLAAACLEVGVYNWKRVKDDEKWRGTPYFQYDPLRQHRPTDPQSHGCSRFREPFAVGEDFDLPGITGEVEIVPGHVGWYLSRVFVIRRGEAPDVGMFARSSVPDGTYILIDTPHGGHLQAVVHSGSGDWSNADAPVGTPDWCFVLTYEGPSIGWMLASCYPGEPDPTPCFDGLKSGDLISPDEARARNLRVKEVQP